LAMLLGRKSVTLPRHAATSSRPAIVFGSAPTQKMDVFMGVC
jgi:hypothetical protein